MVARLSPGKDVGSLLHALAILSKERPSIQLAIAGDGPCREELQQLSSTLGLGGRVRFLGNVQNVPALLADASLFVLPSLSEGISLTLLEAMARGLPVVATRVGGNPEVVIDGETGLLVPAQSPRELAAAIGRIAGDWDQGRQMGLAGRKRVERHFDIRRMVASYHYLYCELLSENKALVEPGNEILHSLSLSE
jgi:glycosyltransferase involved in cell wall biosynthesis